MSMALQCYAGNNIGHFPTGQPSPEASLSLLCRSNYVDAYTLRGMTLPEKQVRAILEAGALLEPATCGWHYTDGLTVADDPHLALLYCKQPLGHNGKKTTDGGRQVAFVDGAVEWVSGDKWAVFLEEQKVLLSKCGERSIASGPLVDATIEVPDGRSLENIDAPYVLEQNSGTSSGTAPNRCSLMWFHPPYNDSFTGQFTLAFSNLVSEPVIVTFTNGIPDKTNAVFKMRKRK